MGRDPLGPLGGDVLYVLSSQGFGWPTPQPVAWVGGDSFEMLPEPSDLCWTIEGGDNWVVRFGRGAGGNVSTATVEGVGTYPVRLERQH